MPELLNDPEYRTGYMGKWHLGDEVFAQHGFEEWVSIEDHYYKYFSKGRDRSARSSYNAYLKSLGLKPDRQHDDVFGRKFATEQPIEHCKPAFLARSAIDFLQRHQNNPFILYVNFLEPHTPYNGPLNKLHNRDEIELPENYNDVLEENELLRHHLHQEQHIDKYELNDPKKARGWIRKYWGLVAQVDRAVGEILGKLEELGLDDNTIVVFTSDHGDQMTSHRMCEKSVMFEESVRVPHLIRVPGHSPRRISRPVSHISIVPTLLELMGSDAGHSLPGQSLVPDIRGEEVSPEPVFIQWNPNDDRTKFKRGTKLATSEQIEAVDDDFIRTVVTPDGWKLALSKNDQHQLFNHNTDPHETTNLFGQPEYQYQVNELAQSIAQYQARLTDMPEAAVLQDVLK